MRVGGIRLRCILGGELPSGTRARASKSRYEHRADRSIPGRASGDYTAPLNIAQPGWIPVRYKGQGRLHRALARTVAVDSTLPERFG